MLDAGTTGRGGRRLLVLAVLLGGGGAAAQELDFTAAQAKYQAMLSRPSLSRRIDGRRLLAVTNDPRAFAILSKDYLAPEEPRDFVRSLLVTLLADFQHLEAPHEAWRAWRTSLPKAEHAWLWYRALGIEESGDPGGWRAVAADPRRPIELRAVALAAGAARRGGVDLDDTTLALVMELAGNVGSSGGDRSLVLEGLMGLFAAKADPLQDKQRHVLRALVSVMGERGTSTRSQIVQSRLLARALGRDNIGPDAASWLELLADAPTAAIELAYAAKRAAVKVGFFGIPEHGRTLAYVIDASDSMLEPLTPRELEDLQPLTGVGATKGGAGGAGAQAEQSIDWSRVKTRFDGARELLKLALRRLPADARFTVVLFGDKAEYLVATPGLVTASGKAVDAACLEVDAIRSGPVRAGRPHGTLRGSTNIHGGFLRAFRATDAKKTGARNKKGSEGRSEIRLDERGVDTIYLLSDGDPSADDWDGGDTNDGTTVGDPETGATKEHTGQVVYPGPFSWEPYLVADLQRLNLLQRCAIHAVGIGEANYDLLAKVAATGQGTVVQIGKK